MSQVKRPPLRHAFRALRNRNYRLFWLGQLASLSGTWMQRIAQAWLVLQLTDSPQALGLVTAIQFSPILLFSLVGGVLADRLPKRRVLVLTQAVMLAQAIGLGLLVASGQVEIWHIYAMAAVLGLASAVDNPTRQAFLVEMVGQNDLPNAVALNSAQFNASRILGPALGGVTIAVIGIAGCFLLNGVSYLAVIGGLLFMRADTLMPAPTAKPASLLSQIGEGLRYARHTPDVALVVVLVAFIGTFGYNFTVMLPLLAQYVLRVEAVGFSLLASAMGAGSLVAALGLAYIGRSERRTLLLGAAGFSLLLFATALSPWWLLTMLLLAALGFCSIVFSATANTRLQLATPGHLRGRIMSIYSLLLAGTTPIGSLALGSVAEWTSVPVAVGGAAVLCGVGVVVALFYLRRLGPRLTNAPLAPPGPSTPARSSQSVTGD